MENIFRKNASVIILKGTQSLDGKVSENTCTGIITNVNKKDRTALVQTDYGGVHEYSISKLERYNPKEHPEID